MRAIFILSLRQIATPKKIAVTLILMAIPIGITIVARTFVDDSELDGFVEVMIERFLAAVILPLLSITVATAIFGNELEDKTLGFLMTKPIARWKIAIPKYASAVLYTVPPISVTAIVATVLVISTEPKAILTVLVAVVLGVMAYTSVFTWLGLMTSRALAFALLYVFIWEGLLTQFLAGIRFVSIRGYVIGILHGIDNESFGALAPRAIDLYAALVGAILVTAIFFFLTVRRLNKMDVP